MTSQMTSDSQTLSPLREPQPPSPLQDLLLQPMVPGGAPSSSLSMASSSTHARLSVDTTADEFFIGPPQPQSLSSSSAAAANTLGNPAGDLKDCNAVPHMPFKKIRFEKLTKTPTASPPSANQSNGHSNSLNSKRSRHPSQTLTSAPNVNQRKHFFILSSSGKPIYSRYGNDLQAAEMMAVIQTIISFFLDDQDPLKSIVLGNGVKLVFMIRGPLYYVASSPVKEESESQLKEQLGILHGQMVSTLTMTQITRIFKEHPNFDLRSLMGGTEPFLDHLTYSFEYHSWHFMDAVPSLKVPSKLRKDLGELLLLSTSSLPHPKKNLFFGLLISNRKLITSLRLGKYTLHPSDVHLLLNMIYTSSSFQVAESWTPVCLPKFNSNGFLYCYVCFLGPQLVLVLLSAEKEAFFELSDLKTRFVESLVQYKDLEVLTNCVKSDPLNLVELGLPGILHFMYKSKPLLQLFEPRKSAPYTRKQDWKRLLRKYKKASLKLRIGDVGVVFEQGEEESVYACHTINYELYLTFGPFVNLGLVQKAKGMVLEWIKVHEESLFVHSSPVL